MGFLKKLYGEAQKVRHSGNLGKEVKQVGHGVKTKGGKAYAKAKQSARYASWQIKMKFGR